MDTDLVWSIVQFELTPLMTIITPNGQCTLYHSYLVSEGVAHYKTGMTGGTAKIDQSPFS